MPGVENEGTFLAQKLAEQLDGMEAPTFEWRFHPTRRWRFDLAWPRRLVAAEIHGAVFQQGRHTRGAGFAKDREKMNTAQLYGWSVFEFTPTEVRNGNAARTLRAYLQGGVAV